LRRAGRRPRRQALGLGKPGNDAGIDAIGLLEKAHGLGKPPHRARVGEGNRHALPPQEDEGQLLVPTRRLHGDESDTLLPAECRKRFDPWRIVGEAPHLRAGAKNYVETSRRYINSTNELGHGNLPCPCERRSSDCSVVRDNGDGPKAHPRLWPEVGRAPVAARGGRWPSAPSQRRFHHIPPPPSRYKVGRTANVVADTRPFRKIAQEPRCGRLLRCAALLRARSWPAKFKESE